MALGGGIFTTENKVLPGSYINFVSTKNLVNVFGERGIGAICGAADWCDEKKIIELTGESLRDNSFRIFGYDYSHEKLRGIRDFFKNGSKLYFYRGNGTTSTAASCRYCTAAKKGARGNDLRLTIEDDIGGKKLVEVYLENALVYSQSVTDASELVNNEFVVWNGESLENTEGMSFTGGKTGSISGTDIAEFLKAVEPYYFNTLCAVADLEDYVLMVLEFTKRMREQVGRKFQCVTYGIAGQNYEGSICTCNDAEGAPAENADLLYWITGAVAGCPVNKSLTNKLYDGETPIRDVNFTQSVLEKRIKEGYFSFHKVEDKWRVLMDINTLTEFTEEKSEIFSDNQTVRVIDQIAEDIASIFCNYYLGKVPNDEAGRNSLWCDIVKHHEKLRDMRAIENFNEDDIVVKRGETKRSVVVYDNITPVNAMAQLYMKVTVE